MTRLHIYIGLGLFALGLLIGLALYHWGSGYVLPASSESATVQPIIKWKKGKTQTVKEYIKEHPDCAECLKNITCPKVSTVKHIQWNQPYAAITESINQAGQIQTGGRIGDDVIVVNFKDTRITAFTEVGVNVWNNTINEFYGMAGVKVQFRTGR